MTSALLHLPAVRFVITGSAAALLQFALTAAFVNAGLMAAYASAGAYGLAMVAAYLAHRRWTFRSVRLSARRSAPRYLAVQLLSAAAAMMTASASALLGLDSLGIAVASTLASSTLSFVLSSRWAFRPARRRGADIPLQELSSKAS